MSLIHGEGQEAMTAEARGVLEASGQYRAAFWQTARDVRVNEVFFDDVMVADSHRLLPVGGGFGMAMATLMIERYAGVDSGLRRLS